MHVSCEIARPARSWRLNYWRPLYCFRPRDVTAAHSLGPFGHNGTTGGAQASADDTTSRQRKNRRRVFSVVTVFRTGLTVIRRYASDQNLKSSGPHAVQQTTGFTDALRCLVSDSSASRTGGTGTCSPPIRSDARTQPAGHQMCPMGSREREPRTGRSGHIGNGRYILVRSGPDR